MFHRLSKISWNWGIWNCMGECIIDFRRWTPLYIFCTDYKWSKILCPKPLWNTFVST